MQSFEKCPILYNCLLKHGFFYKKGVGKRKDEEVIGKTKKHDNSYYYCCCFILFFTGIRPQEKVCLELFQNWHDAQKPQTQNPL